MKLSIVSLAFVLALCALHSGPANANANDQAQQPGTAQPAIPNLAVKERLKALEQINVTANKTPEPIDDKEIQDIIDNAQKLEADAEG